MARRSSLEAKLSTLLNTTRGEGEISRFLKENPRILHEAFGPSFTASCLVSEFSLGDQYRADFVLMTPYSGAWNIHFIELEPVDAALFTQKGVPAKRLNTGLSQFREWRVFATKNREYFAQQIARAVSERDLIHPERIGKEPKCSAGLKLTDPRTMLGFYFHVLIGRRSELSPEQVERKNSIGVHDDVEVATYDRLLQAAKSLDLKLGSNR